MPEGPERDEPSAMSDRGRRARKRAHLNRLLQDGKRQRKYCVLIREIGCKRGRQMGVSQCGTTARFIAKRGWVVKCVLNSEEENNDDIRQRPRLPAA